VVTSLHYARGLAAVARDNYKTAHVEFAQCAEDDSTCDYLHLRAGQRAGDQATVVTLRKKLLAQYRRDPSSLLVRTQLDADPTR
jgi:hypothetical protein